MNDWSRLAMRSVSTPNRRCRATAISDLADGYDRFASTTQRDRSPPRIDRRLQEERVIDKQGNRFQLDIIGGFESESYEREVKQRADQLGIGQAIRWLGFTNDVPAAMQSLDAMILPSLFGEGMPMVVLEAMAMGVPVIATRVEGTRKLFETALKACLPCPVMPQACRTPYKV